MSEPRRWKDSPDAPIGVRELLGSAAPRRSLDEVTFRKGARRVATFAVLPAATAAASLWTKLAAAGAIGVATIGTIVAVEVARDASTSPVAPAAIAPRAAPTLRADAPRETLPPLPTPPVEPAAAVVVRAPTRSAPVATPSATPIASAAPWIPEETVRPKSTLGDELVLLQRARERLERSPETALSELEQHRALYPTGTLAAERDLMELDALRRAGRMQDASNRARAWLARDPHGMHSTRVRQILSTLE